MPALRDMKQIQRKFLQFSARTQATSRRVTPTDAEEETARGYLVTLRAAMDQQLKVRRPDDFDLPRWESELPPLARLIVRFSAEHPITPAEVDHLLTRIGRNLAGETAEELDAREANLENRRLHEEQTARYEERLVYLRQHRASESHRIESVYAEDRAKRAAEEAEKAAHANTVAGQALALFKAAIAHYPRTLDEQAKADELQQIIRSEVSAFIARGGYPPPSQTVMEKIEETSKRLAGGFASGKITKNTRAVVRNFGPWIVEGTLGWAPSGERAAFSSLEVSTLTPELCAPVGRRETREELDAREARLRAAYPELMADE